jgi:hypothetical protein
VAEVLGPAGAGVSLLRPYLLPWSAVRAGEFIRARRLPIQLTNECYPALFTGNAVTEAKLGAVLACHETYHMWGEGTGAPVTIEVQGSNASYLSAGAMELLYALTTVRGVRGLNYYMTVGGTNPPGFEHITGAEYDIDAPIAEDGTTRPHYDAIGKLSRIMDGWLGQRLTSAVPLRDVWIACYAPYEMAAVTGGAAVLGTTGIAQTFDGAAVGAGRRVHGRGRPAQARRLRPPRRASGAAAGRAATRRRPRPVPGDGGPHLRRPRPEPGPSRRSRHS